MDFSNSPVEEWFRDEVRKWLQANLPVGWGKHVHEPTEESEKAAFRLEWERKLHRGGWAGISWPREYGGRGATLMEHAIFLEEMARVNAPEGINIIGRNLVGPTLIAHGTEEQKRRFLPPLLAGDEVWCQGFSEPNSGSDLASLQCKAVLDGDHFVVNGQKTWTSFAQHAQWCIMLVRTDSAVPKHKGISFLLVEMKSPGITIRPVVQITGESEFSETFFDDVQVPVENVVGDLNEGWKIAMTTLTHERGPVEALARQVRFRMEIQSLVRTARKLTIDGRFRLEEPVIRQKLASCFIEVELMRLNCLRGFTRMIQGRDMGPESSFTKLYWSHVHQRMAETALEIEGPLSPYTAGDPLTLEDGLFQYLFLQSRAETIYSGTSEIQRNIIAERVLGLPK